MNNANTILHVAPNGMDSYPGTTERPLASLEGARRRVRELKLEGVGIEVIFSAGVYRFVAPVHFDADDSGTPAAPITYRGNPGFQPVFSGSCKPITEWVEVNDPLVLSRLSNEVVSSVRMADLSAHGITDFGRLSVRGFGTGTLDENENFGMVREHGFGASGVPAEAELFWNGKPMTLARWPNRTFSTIRGYQGTQDIFVDTDRLGRWTSETDPWIMAYWNYDWAEAYEPLVMIDPASGRLRRSSEVTPTYGISQRHAKWYAYNLLAELDRPGEYYLDRHDGLLYFWPPSLQGEAVLSVADGFVRAKGLSNVTFQRLTFEFCRGTAIVVSGGADCHIVASTIRNTGQCAVVAIGGERHEVYGCDIYGCGEGGIGLGGTGRRRLSPTAHSAENNHIHHYSRRVVTHKPAIGLQGVGCRVARNLVHDGPDLAISVTGNDHIIEYNEVHNVLTNGTDSGALYAGRDWTQRGTIVRYNYWHEICGSSDPWGIIVYLDDQLSGVSVLGNLFERCANPIFIGGGNDNSVVNNVFVECWKTVHIDNRGMNWQKRQTEDPNWTLQRRLGSIPYRDSLWRRRYPTLASVLEDEVGVPKRNVVRFNLSESEITEDIHPVVRGRQTIGDNECFEWIKVIASDHRSVISLEFEDVEKVSGIWVKPVVLEKMGVYDSPRRTQWPVKHPVTRVKMPRISWPLRVAQTLQGCTFDRITILQIPIVYQVWRSIRRVINRFGA